MNPIDELALHVQALATAVDANKKFFASITHYLRRLHELVTTARDALTQSELRILAGRIENFYSQWRPSGDELYIPPRETLDTDETVQHMNRIVQRLVQMPDEEFRSLTPLLARPAGTDDSAQTGTSETPCVFLGHGRSKLWARIQVLLENELELATVSYESESRTGESIVPILQKMLDQATFAVLVVTAEDETSDGSLRARQNVIHEAGLFQGRLGFRRVILLQQDGIETFSNLAGLQYVPFSGDSIEQSFYELQRALKREGLLS